MPALTDNQLADLLRETFADHEAGAPITLPQATKRRHFVPALVAAAATVAVLGGTLYAVHGDDPVPPVGQSPTVSAGLPASSDAAAWAKAIRKIAQDHAPAGGWKLLEIRKSWGPFGSTGSRLPVKRPSSTPTPVPVLGRAEQEEITRSLRDVAPVTWQEGLQNLTGKPGLGTAQIMIHPVTRTAAHPVVEVSLFRSVYDGAHWLVVDSYTEKVVVS